MGSECTSHPLLLTVYRLTGAPNTGGSAIVYNRRHEDGGHDGHHLVRTDEIRARARANHDFSVNFKINYQPLKLRYGYRVIQYVIYNYI